MFVKKIVFVSSMAFEANVSIIKRLKEKYDVYFFTMLAEKSSIGNIRLKKTITDATEIPEFEKFSNFIDLSKTFAVRHKSKNLINKLQIDWKVYMQMIKLRPDVIFVDSATINYCLLRILFRKKIFSIIHDPFLHSGEKKMSRKFSNFMLRKFATRYILFNQKQSNDFAKLYKISSDKIITSFLSQYEYLTLFDDKSTLLFKDKGFNILFWGRISKYKGIRYLLDAINICSKRGVNDINVIVAGKGEFDFDIRQYKHLENVKIINRFLDTGELVSLLKKTDLVVCPYTDATQSGVIMSAYAFKRPVLATNVGGLPEMLCDGLLGTVVPPCSAEPIADTIVLLMNDKKRIRQFSDNIEKMYFGNGYRSWNVAVDIIIEGIELFLNRRNLNNHIKN